MTALRAVTPPTQTHRTCGACCAAGTPPAAGNTTTASPHADARVSMTLERDGGRDAARAAADDR